MCLCGSSSISTAPAAAASTAASTAGDTSPTTAAGTGAAATRLEDVSNPILLRRNGRALVAVDGGVENIVAQM